MEKLKLVQIKGINKPIKVREIFVKYTGKDERGYLLVGEKKQRVEEYVMDYYKKNNYIVYNTGFNKFVPKGFPGNFNAFKEIKALKKFLNFFQYIELDLDKKDGIRKFDDFKEFKQDKTGKRVKVNKNFKRGELKRLIKIKIKTVKKEYKEVIKNIDNFKNKSGKLKISKRTKTFNNRVEIEGYDIGEYNIPYEKPNEKEKEYYIKIIPNIKFSNPNSKSVIRWMDSKGGMQLSYWGNQIRRLLNDFYPFVDKYEKMIIAFYSNQKGVLSLNDRFTFRGRNLKTGKENLKEGEKPLKDRMKGVPDLCCYNIKNDKFFFSEVKSEKDILSKYQKDFINFIQDECGYDFELVKVLKKENKKE